MVKQALGSQAQLLVKHQNVLMQENELVDDITSLQTKIDKKDDEIHDLREQLRNGKDALEDQVVELRKRLGDKDAQLK